MPFTKGHKITGTRMLGMKHSEASKEKMRQAQYNNPKAFKVGHKLHVGMKRSDEFKMACSLRMKKFLSNPENKKKFMENVISKATEKNTKLGTVRVYPKEFNRNLKDEIRLRDEYLCQNCDITEEEHIIVFGKVLTIHHIDYNKSNCDNKNLITLCISCNVRANHNRWYWKGYYGDFLPNVIKKP